MNPYVRTFDPHELGQERLHNAASRGDLVAVKALLPDTTGNISNYKEDVLMPMLAETAILHRKIGILRWCIDNGLRLPRLGANSPIYLAACEARCPDIWKLLHDRGMALNLLWITAAHDETLGREFTALDIAAEEGDVELFKTLLNLSKHMTSLHDCGIRAIIGGSDRVPNNAVEILNAISESGFDLKPAFTSQVAAASGNFEALVYLTTELGMDINMPLFRACWAGQYVCTEFLLDAGADPNFVSNDRGDPISSITIAKLKGHYSVVDLLVKRGAVDHLYPTDDNYDPQHTSLEDIGV